MITCDIELDGKKFTNQQIEIDREPQTVRQGVDGIASRGNHPTKIKWFGGTVAGVAGVSNVKIVGQGRIVIDATLNTFYNQPRAIAGGVEFDVLEGQ